MFKKLILIFCLMLGACGLETYQSGDLPEIKRLESIQKGDSKEKVWRVLGTPNYTSSPNEGVEDLMIYAQIKKESRVFFNPEIVDEDTYVYIFDDTGKVKDIHHFTQKDMKQVSFETATTEIGGETKSVWEELANNFGRYNAGGQDSTVRR